MNELEADAVLDDYVARHPVARAATMNDPLFAAQMAWMKRTFSLLEPALYREGLDRRAVLRVVNTLVYGVPEPDAAIERMADFQVRLQQMQDAVIGDFNPGHQFTGLFGDRA